MKLFRIEWHNAEIVMAQKVQHGAAIFLLEMSPFKVSIFTGVSSRYKLEVNI